MSSTQIVDEKNIKGFQMVSMHWDTRLFVQREVIRALTLKIYYINEKREC